MTVRYPAWGGKDLSVSPLEVKSIGNFEVNNGELKIMEVPDLMFNKTKLSSDLNGTLVDLVKEDNIIKVSDYRGTNAISESDTSIARQDWDLFVTASPFQDEKQQEVNTDSLSLAYVTGETIEDVSNGEVLISEHLVEGETPKNNHTHILDEEANHFKVFVKNRNNLKSIQEYKATVTYELRQAP